MNSVFAKVSYLNQDLYNSVKKDADSKFGAESSYVKNLWTLKEYKKRGGKVKYSGEKPSKNKVSKQIEGEIEVDLSEAIFLYNINNELKSINSDEMNEDIEIFIDDYKCDSLGYFFDEDYCEASQDEIDQIYKKYHSLVNMSYSELKNWSENPCSKVASLSRSPINRNLRLLSKSKDQWTMGDARSANRTISFISRMKGAEQGEKTKTSDGKSCPSKRDISLMNWAYRP